MLNGGGGRKAVWLKWESGCMVEAGVYAEWPRWACGCVAEVGEWLYGRGGRVAVQLRSALQWFGEGHERFTLKVKHAVTESLGWKSFKGKCSTRWECGCVNEVGVWVLWPRWECGCANQWGV